MKPKVYCSLVDNKTRCTHYHTDVDIIAIKFKCCDKYYPCYQCHAEHESHPVQRWSQDEWDTKAILCGVCKHELTIREYMNTDHCPQCGAQFNARCQLHYHHYFETDEA
ncbi:CHY zinc finger protein [Staphylococcus auricularis]|uniref:CHY zinc finger protein n=1 Tax=Staphylococcus auricularis TaxID=29379 RepID=UPI000D1B1BA7|nr:CHY zinc finger protein [Staphylococcus auricularis]PTH27325.1 hypothetical protein BU608_02100 [Staphylococcus auricularis]